VPEGRSIAGLDKSALGLFPARVETLCGFVFVNLDVHARSLAEQIPGLAERLRRYPIEELRQSGSWDGDQPANWKLVVDNYNEGYHIPIGHPGLMRLLDYKRYEVEVHDGWVWFEAPLRDKPSGNPVERAYQSLVRPMPGLAPEERRVWRYAFIYPNTMIDL
jgi:phenylpropionate dioxygenase-like ring-hydroxylating dioxygenase large terminal subunit